MKIEILDLDRSTHPDGFSVTYDAGNGEETALIKYDDLGDWLVAAGHVDGFDGERLIWYGAPDFRRDNLTGELIEKKGRDHSQPIAEFVRHDLDDETIAAYVAELITQKNVPA